MVLGRFLWDLFKVPGLFFYGSMWVNMVFHGSMSCFHDPRWILMVINVSRLFFS